MRKMMLTGMMVAIWCGGLAFGDPIDDAEAKRRGVAVEVVQLERAREQIAQLQKEKAAMSAELTKLRTAVVAMQNGKGAAKPSATEPTQTQLANGMTLEQAKAAFPAKWVLSDESNGIQHYSCRWLVPDADAIRERELRRDMSDKTTPWKDEEMGTVDVESGKVTNYSVRTEAMKTARAFGGGPPDEVIKKKP